MKQTITILIADKPNANGRVYPRHVIEEALKKLGDKPLLGRIDIGGKEKTEINEVTHIAKNLHLEGNQLVADIEIAPGPNGDKLKVILQHTTFRPEGIGDVTFQDEHYIISNYEITSVNATPKKDI